MTLYNGWTAKLGSSTDIPNIQSIQMTVGRENPSDPWSVATAEIVAWYPTGYATPLANLSIGRTVRIYAPSSTHVAWCGSVKDVALEVGIPWNSGTTTGNGDFIRISCEGYGATLGRIDSYTTNMMGIPAASVNGLLTGLDAAPANLTIGWDTRSPSASWDTDSANNWDPPDTWTYQPWQLLQQIATLTETKICDGLTDAQGRGAGVGSATAPGILLSDPGRRDNAGASSFHRIAPTEFSDTTNDATHRKYDSVTFDSLGDNYYTQAIINDVISDHTASIGSSPYRTFYSQGPEEASTAAYGANYDDQATRYAQMFNTPTIAISSISATTADQQTQNLHTLGLYSTMLGPTDPIALGEFPIHCINVTFRGTTYLCQIEGVTISADLEQTRFTYRVSPAAMTNFFRLNDTNFGVLDTNRLARYSN